MGIMGIECTDCSCFSQGYNVSGVRYNRPVGILLFIIVPCLGLSCQKCKNLRLSDCYTSSSFICLYVGGGWVGRKDNPDTTTLLCYSASYASHALQSPSSAWTILQYANNIQPIPPLLKRPYTDAFPTTSTLWNRGNRKTWTPLWVAPSVYPRAGIDPTRTRSTHHYTPQPSIHHQHNPQWSNRHPISCSAQQQHWRQTSTSSHIPRSR